MACVTALAVVAMYKINSNAKDIVVPIATGILSLASGGGGVVVGYSMAKKKGGADEPQT